MPAAFSTGKDYDEVIELNKIYNEGLFGGDETNIQTIVLT